jgi:Putative peptidoglycan binding domain
MLGEMAEKHIANRLSHDKTQKELHMSTYYFTSGENHILFPPNSMARAIGGIIRKVISWMCVCPRRTMAFVIFVTTLAVTVNCAAEDDEEAAAGFAPPWTSAQEASNYIIVGRSYERHEKGSLINVSTGEVAREVAMEDFGNLRTGAYLIDGAPGAFLDIHLEKIGRSWSPLEALRLSGGGGFVDDGWVSSILPERKPRYYNGPNKSGVIWAGYYIRENLRQTVWIKEGDIWIGDIDWVGGDIVNQRQVTKVGQFKWNTGQKRDAHLVCWSGQNLFIEAGFDPKKPLVRVNLTDGSVQELDWLMYEGKSIANKVVIDPAERVAIDFRVEGIRLIDLTSGKVLKVDWGAIARTGLSVRKQPLDDREVTGLGKKDHWIDQNRYVVGFTMMSDSPQQAAVVLDLQQGKLNLTPVEAIDYKGKAGRYQTSRIDVISGGKPAIITQASWRWLGGDFDDHYTEALIDLETGRAWPARKERGSGWHYGWIDGHRFLYPVTDKGLSGNGAYLFDRLTGTSTKIAPFPKVSKETAVAQGKVIVFERGGDVYRVNADGSELKKIASDVKLLASFQPEPVNVSVNVSLGSKQPIAAAKATATAAQADSDRKYKKIFQTTHPLNDKDAILPTGPLVFYDGMIYGTAAGGPQEQGLIFKMKPDGSGFEAIHSFFTREGRLEPPRTLLLSSDGWLYGVTELEQGSSNPKIFRLRPAGSDFQTLQTFESNAADLIASKDGRVYGIVGSRPYPGGVPFKLPVGDIFCIDAAGHYKELTDGGKERSREQALGAHSDTGGSTAPIGPFGPFVAGNDGNLYGIVENGLYRIGADGKGLRWLHRFAGPPDDGVTDPNAWDDSVPVLLENDTLVGILPLGGKLGGGVIYWMKTDGTGYQTLALEKNHHPIGMPLVAHGNSVYGIGSGGVDRKTRRKQSALVRFADEKLQTVYALPDEYLYRLKSLVNGPNGGTIYGVGYAISKVGQIFRMTLGPAEASSSSESAKQPTLPGKNQAVSMQPAAIGPEAAKSKSEPVTLTAHDNSSPAEGSMVKPLPLFGANQQSFISERDRLKQALKDEPPEIREFGMKAYELNAENYVLGFFFKRLETALAMVETRKRVGDIARPFVISKTKFTPDLVDQEKAKKCFHDKAMDLIRHDKDLTPQQKEQIATEAAERATRAFTPNPQIEIDRINDLFMKALQAVEAAHKAASSGMPRKNHKPVSSNPGAPNSQATKSQSKPINLPAASNPASASDSMTDEPQRLTTQASHGWVDKTEESPATSPESATTPKAHTLNTVFDNGPYADYNAHSRRQILRRAQGKLRGVGLYHGGIDGAMGPGTQAAIIAWQQQENIPVTGLLDHQTLQSMYLLGLAEQSPPRRRIYQGEQVREYDPGADAAEVLRRVLPWTP